MQDQGKRLLLAVALALGVLLVWQMLFPPPKKPDEKKPGAVATGSATTGPAGTVTAKSTSQVGVSTEKSSAPRAEVQRGPEQLITLKFPKFVATFSSWGGDLKSWKLTDDRYQRDPTKGELVPSASDTGELNVNFANSTYVLPAKAEWTGTQISDHQVSYKISTPELDVEKVFEIVPDSYLVRMTVKTTVKVPAGHEAHQSLAVTSYGFQDPKDNGGGDSSRVAARVWESATRRDGEILATPYASLREHARFESNIQWTGFDHPYLMVTYSPRPVLASPVEKHTFAEETPGLMRTDIVFAPATFKPGSPPLERELVGYLGPKNYDSLKSADSAAGFSTGFDSVVDLGWFGFIGRPLLWLLLKFHDLFGNWGIAIVLLTILVKGATIYWTTKSMRSMKAMAVLAPQMKALQEKYKDDKQRLQVETMALYKQHGANPLSGCLPILLQMPIWLALYRMLSNAGELYQQPFIPGWINDLTRPDPFYVLPVVLVVTMFAQARLTPQSPDPSQRTQQKIMQYGMPLMFGAMSFFFPAGLTLYIFTNTCLSALHSIYMNKFDKKSLAFAAQIREAQEKAAAGKKQPEAVKSAKDANPKSSSRPVTSDDDDSDNDDDDAVAETKTAQPARQRPKKKKGRR